MPPIDWQPWHTAPFLDAQRRRRPILLLLETAWAPACDHVHAAVFSRTDVQQAVAETSVAVRVDADLRPDIADRYGLGHWPSVLFLTPEGHVLTGGTRVGHAFAQRIRDVAEAFRAGDRRWCRELAGAAAAMEPHASAALDDALALASLAAAVWEARDAHGAFVHEGLPSAQAASFALMHGLATDDGAWLDAAATTLDALADLPFPTDAAGAVARVTGVPGARLEERADWVAVHARMLRVDRRRAWREQLEVLVGQLRGFRRHDGSFRPWTSSPPGLVLADATARACRALLAAADVLERPELAREAIDAIEALAPRAYGRAAGVAHVLRDGHARGPALLDDAMVLAHALLDADGWRADSAYADLADELARTSAARLQDGSGALLDRVATLAGAGRVGRLGEPHYPIVGNAEAARLLVRLRGDDPAAVSDARRLLRAVTPRACDAGVFAAPVALAWHAVGPADSVAAAW